MADTLITTNGHGRLVDAERHEAPVPPPCFESAEPEPDEFDGMSPDKELLRDIAVWLGVAALALLAIASGLVIYY